MTILGIDGTITDNQRDLLNRMNETARLTQLGDKLFSSKVSYLGIYDFAVQGGAISTINLDDAKGEDLKIPDNFVCTNVIMDKITSVQGSDTTSDIAIGLNSTGDILAALAETTADGTGLIAGIPVGTAATAVKTTAEKNATITITTKVLTAGKWYVQFEGFLSETF